MGLLLSGDIKKKVKMNKRGRGVRRCTELYKNANRRVREGPTTPPKINK